MNFLKKAWQWASQTQARRFLINGQFVMLADLIPYYLLLIMLGNSHYMVANNTSSVISSVFNFGMQKYWVFNDRRPHQLLKQILAFTITSVGFIFVSNIVLMGLVEGLHIHPMIAKWIKIVIMGVVSWFVSSKAIFKAQQP